MASNFLNYFNQLGSSDHQLPTIHIKELEENVKFKITSARIVNTRYGARLVVATNEFNTFFPTVFNTLNKEKLTELETLYFHIEKIDDIINIRFSDSI